VDQGGAGEKEEPNRVKGEEGQGTCEALEVHGIDIAMTNQCGAEGMSGADRSTYLVVMGMEVLEEQGF